MGARPLGARTALACRLGPWALAASCARLVLGFWTLERLIRYSLNTAPPGACPYGWPPCTGASTLEYPHHMPRPSYRRPALTHYRTSHTVYASRCSPSR